MESLHEIMYYLRAMRAAIVDGAVMPGEDEPVKFEPQAFVLAVKLPNGAVEVMINHTMIVEKIDYILETYNNETLEHNSVPGLVIQNMMVV